MREFDVDEIIQYVAGDDSVAGIREIEDAMTQDKELAVQIGLMRAFLRLKAYPRDNSEASSEIRAMLPNWTALDSSVTVPVLRGDQERSRSEVATQNLHPECDELEVWSMPDCQRAFREIARAIIQSDEKPDYLLAINDPESPGGVTITKHIARCISQLPPYEPIPVGEVRVEGRPESQAGAKMESQRRCTYVSPLRAPKRVLLLDDVAFSGNSFKVAAEGFLGFYPSAKVAFAALAAGKDVVPNANERSADRWYEIEAFPLKPMQLRLLYWFKRVPRKDVFFPWNRVGPTAPMRSPLRMDRPWGWMDIFAMNENRCSVRMLTLEPNRRLSLHFHEHRDELFVALDDGIVVQVGIDEEKATVVHSGDHRFVPSLVPHRFTAPDRWVRCLEIAFSEEGYEYDQDDIVRLDDDFERPERGDPSELKKCKVG